jgi:hypothetical protein
MVCVIIERVCLRIAMVQGVVELPCPVGRTVRGETAKKKQGFVSVRGVVAR